MKNNPYGFEQEGGPSLQVRNPFKGKSLYTL